MFLWSWNNWLLSDGCLELLLYLNPVPLLGIGRGDAGMKLAEGISSVLMSQPLTWRHIAPWGECDGVLGKSQSTDFLFMMMVVMIQLDGSTWLNIWEHSSTPKLPTSGSFPREWTYILCGTKPWFHCQAPWCHRIHLTTAEYSSAREIHRTRRSLDQSMEST
jgi:hypothetical protein